MLLLFTISQGTNIQIRYQDTPSNLDRIGQFIGGELGATNKIYVARALLRKYFACVVYKIAILQKTITNMEISSPQLYSRYILT